MNRGFQRGPPPWEARAATFARQCTLPWLVLFLLAAPACDRNAAASAEERERFVRAYVALGEAGDDPAERDSVLAEHRLTSGEMAAFVRRKARDPRRLAQLWDEIRDIEQEALRAAESDRPRPPADTGAVRLDPGDPPGRQRLEDPGAVIDERERLREQEEAEAPERDRIREMEIEIERARQGREDASGEPPLDVAEPELPPESVEEGLTGEPDDL